MTHVLIGVAGCMLATSLLSTTTTQACRMPMCRYALLNWEPENYEVHVVYPAGAVERARAVERTILARASEGKRKANLRVMLKEASGDPPEKLHHDAEGSLLLEVRTPDKEGNRPVFWSAPFSETAVEQIIDSPARRRVARELLDGRSAAWLLITTGKVQADEQAATILRRHLDRLSETLELSPDASVAGDPMADATAERPTFAVVPVDASDPAERFLVASILSMAGADEMTAPLAVPVYGKGRAHAFITGDDFDADVIEASCRFLVGACSCTARALAPGCDLLLRADWRLEVEEHLIEMIDLAPLDGDQTVRKEQARPTPTQAAATSSQAPAKTAGLPESGRASLMSNTFLSLAMVVLVVVLGTAVVLIRSAKPSD